MNEQRDIVHCAFSTDENYAQHCGAAMASMLINNPDSYFHFHLVQDGLPKKSLDRLLATVALYANGRIDVYYMERAAFAHFRVDDHITLATYYRLFLPVLLPSTIERVLYFDSDLIVRRSILPLWKCDLEGHPIAAIFDTHSDGSVKRLGLPSDYPYFNGGILVIDLATWRARNLLPTFVDFIERNHGRLRYHDQDVMNIIFRDDVKYLDLKWNRQAHVKSKYLASGIIGTTDLPGSLANPCIVHFTGNRKPWRYQDHVPFEQEYLHYVAKSAFADFRQPDRTAAARFVRWGRTTFPPLFRTYDRIAWRTRRLLRSRSQAIDPTHT